MSAHSLEGEPRLCSGGSTPRETQHDKPETTGLVSGGNHSGTGEKVYRSEGDQSLVRTEDVIRRFVDNTRVRLKPETQRDYSAEFRKFSNRVELQAFSKAQLRGYKGKGLILLYLGEVGPYSRSVVLAQLCSVWTHGLGLDWPIDSRRDLPRAPKTRREGTPPDATVRAWAEALKHEKDPYLRLVWLLVAQHGWRPQHVVKIRWRNVRFDATGTPDAIQADGAEEGFKTNAPVRARLTPDVVDALVEWRRVCQEPLPERPLLPWRSASGRTQPARASDSKQLRGVHWAWLQEKWGLPKLRPKDLRHWVSTACRKAGLSKQASAFLMGHDATQGGAMRDWYDAPQIEDVFDEQASCLPRGPLGLLEAPEVRLTDGVPDEAISLLRAYLNGELSLRDFTGGIDALRVQVRAVPPLP